RIARTGADHELRRRGKNRGVEVLGDGAAVELIRIADPVGSLHSKPQARIVVGGLRYGDGVARLNPNQSRDLPAGDFPELGNVVDPPERENAGDIAARNVLFEMPVVGVGRASGV